MNELERTILKLLLDEHGPMMFMKHLAGVIGETLDRPEHPDQQWRKCWNIAFKHANKAAKKIKEQASERVD